MARPRIPTMSVESSGSSFEWQNRETGWTWTRMIRKTYPYHRDPLISIRYTWLAESSLGLKAASRGRRRLPFASVGVEMRSAYIASKKHRTSTPSCEWLSIMKLMDIRWAGLQLLIFQVHQPAMAICMDICIAAAACQTESTTITAKQSSPARLDFLHPSIPKLRSSP